MRLYEFSESISSGTASIDLIDGMVTRFSGMHSRIRAILQGTFDKNGELSPKTMRFLAGGQKAKIKAEEYDRALKPALYQLVKTTNNQELKDFLSNAVNEQYNLSAIEKVLPNILIRLSDKTGNKKLKSACEVWNSEISKTRQLMNKLENDSMVDDEEDDIPAIPNQPNPVGQQNATVDALVNDILGRIDRKNAGEIRQIIARKENKLQALQNELSRRNLNP